MIRCGWCDQPTEPGRCGACHHEDAARPWVQRGQDPPPVVTDAGRPALDEGDIRHRYVEAKAHVIASGRIPTVEAIAERLDRSPRTVRAWRSRYALR